MRPEVLIDKTSTNTVTAEDSRIPDATEGEPGQRVECEGEGGAVSRTATCPISLPATCSRPSSSCNASAGGAFQSVRSSDPIIAHQRLCTQYSSSSAPRKAP